MRGPSEEGMVKDGDSTGCVWDPGWAVAALCCGVPVVLGISGRVPAVPGGSSWLVQLVLGLARALCCASAVARVFFAVATAVSPQEEPLGVPSIWLQ